MTNPQAAQALKPCPFCGNDEPEFERMGTPRQSCIVVCGNCGARHESSDEGVRSGSSWNDRATQPAPQPEAQALPDSSTLHAAAKAVVAVRKRHGWSPEADAAIHALEAALSSPAPAHHSEDALNMVRPAPAPLTDRTFSALQAMTEGILTRGDPDYMGRRLTECARVMADHGWQTPTPWPNLIPITVTFGPCGIGLDGGM